MKRNAVVSSSLVVSFLVAVLIAQAALAADPLVPPGTKLIGVGDPNLPPGFSSWTEVMAAQLPLVLAGTELNLTFGTALPTNGVEPTGFAGFADMTIDIPSNTLTLHWKGTPPASVPALLARAESSHNIKTTVVEARFSRADYDAEVGRLLADLGPTFGNNIRSLRPWATYNGMLIEANEPTAATNHPAVLALGQRLVARSAGPNPILVQKADPGRPMSRLADTPPWYGGARISLPYVNPPGGSLCTSGFAVYAGSNLYMTTAWHCSTGLSTELVTSYSGLGMGETWFGRSQSTSAGSDSELVAEISSNAGIIYTGGVGTGETTRGVINYGWASNFMGESVCQSGSFSGELCGLMIQSTNITWSESGPPPQTITYGVDAWRGGSPAVASGDSGGPVYIYAGSQVMAAGGVSQGHGAMCSPPPGSLYCFTYLRYVDWNFIQQNEGVHLK